MRTLVRAAERVIDALAVLSFTGMFLCVLVQVILRYGFMEEASIPEGLACAVASRHLPAIVVDDMTVFVRHETIIPKDDHRGMASWRENLFAFMQRNAERTGAFFGVPTRQVVEIGTEIEI